MEDEKVTFETAKLAKEKGFDWPCRYTIDKEFLVEDSLDYNGNPYFRLEDVETASENGFRVYLQPTQSLLQKWLRKVHNIDVTCLPFMNRETKEKHYVCYLLADMGNHIIDKRLNVDSPFYPSTFEQGLRVALKLLPDEKV